MKDLVTSTLIRKAFGNLLYNLIWAILGTGLIFVFGLAFTGGEYQLNFWEVVRFTWFILVGVDILRFAGIIKG